MTHSVRDIAGPVLCSLAIAALVMTGLPFQAAGQAASPADDPSLTGTSHPDDLVLARQLLMDSNETEMLLLNPASVPAKPDLATLKQAAYQVYTNLTAAPHLFPSSTKPVTDKDGNVTPSTAASPVIWDNFDAFYQQMTDAANLAYDMSQGTDPTMIFAQAKMLRTMCDACHTKNMNVFDPTKQP